MSNVDDVVDIVKVRSKRRIVKEGPSRKDSLYIMRKVIYANEIMIVHRCTMINRVKIFGIIKSKNEEMILFFKKKF